MRQSRPCKSGPSRGHSGSRVRCVTVPPGNCKWPSEGPSSYDVSRMRRPTLELGLFHLGANGLPHPLFYHTRGHLGAGWFRGHGLGQVLPPLCVIVSPIPARNSSKSTSDPSRAIKCARRIASFASTDIILLLRVGLTGPQACGLNRLRPE